MLERSCNGAASWLPGQTKHTSASHTQVTAWSNLRWTEHHADWSVTHSAFFSIPIPLRICLWLQIIVAINTGIFIFVCCNKNKASRLCVPSVNYGRFTHVHWAEAMMKTLQHEPQLAHFCMWLNWPIGWCVVRQTTWPKQLFVYSCRKDVDGAHARYLIWNIKIFVWIWFKNTVYCEELANTVYANLLRCTDSIHGTYANDMHPIRASRHQRQRERILNWSQCNYSIVI